MKFRWEVNRAEKCNNCGVEMSEEDYYFYEGLCEKCYNKSLEEDKKFRTVDA